MVSGGYGTVQRTGEISEIKCYKVKILLLSLGSLMPKTYDRDRFLKLRKHTLFFFKKKGRKVNTTLQGSVDSPSHLNSLSLWTRPTV